MSREGKRGMKSRGQAEDGGELAHSVEDMGLPAGYSQWQEGEAGVCDLRCTVIETFGARMLGDR